MKDHTSLTVFGAGQPNVPLSFAGSIVSFPSSTTSPRYLIFSFLNLHFLALKYRSYSHTFQNCLFNFVETINHFGECQNIIYIDNYQVLFNFIFKYFVHHSLEIHWRIAHSEEHNSGFIEFSVCFECSFPFISRSDLNIVVAPLYVKFREVFCSF
jgi:hypothetical protein